MLLERLRLPLPLTEAVCEGCGKPLDEHGRHRAACPKTGRLKKRAGPLESALARVCREAGATVKTNVYLKDLNLGVSANDKRNVEVVALGLPLHNGAQLAVDVTLRTPLTAEGLPRPGATRVGGSVAEAARRDKEATYPELVHSKRCRLVVVALETGGRWWEEAVHFVGALAQSKARQAPKALQFSASLAWSRRWSRLLSTASARSFAQSLVSPEGKLLDFCEGKPPELSTVLLERV